MYAVIWTNCSKRLCATVSVLAKHSHRAVLCLLAESMVRSRTGRIEKPETTRDQQSVAVTRKRALRQHPQGKSLMPKSCFRLRSVLNRTDTSCADPCSTAAPSTPQCLLKSALEKWRTCFAFLAGCHGFALAFLLTAGLPKLARSCSSSWAGGPAAHAQTLC